MTLDPSIILHIGAPVMLLRNLNVSKSLVNGTLGKIIKFD